MIKKLLPGGAAAAICVAVALTGAAHADTTAHGHFSKDGAVWLYKAGGGVCKIYHSRNLTPAKCLNASIVRVENHAKTTGVHGLVNARLYYNQSSQNGGRSAYACISPQDVWTKSRGGVAVKFDQIDPAGTNPAGTGVNKRIWHDVARVQYTSAPCI